MIEYAMKDSSAIADIRHLWEELNEHHISKGSFEDVYREKTFEKRRDELMEKCGESMKIFTASDDSIPVAYCIVSPCEIESLCVSKKYRGHGIGKKLMGNALEWMDELGTKNIVVEVYGGNESVIDFYSEFGFSTRKIIMERRG
ncbi:MAG TPA: GNAT family N-acetyltransferase [Spirochaetota bacterium]|nr:GNAT family N-acetyltransferase [Spirochaetota bacterium]HQE59109.1 GNAT family N-acetyltransferase [Spirochaetota bacterium]